VCVVGPDEEHDCRQDAADGQPSECRIDDGRAAASAPGAAVVAEPAGAVEDVGDTAEVRLSIAASTTSIAVTWVASGLR